MYTIRKKSSLLLFFLVAVTLSFGTVNDAKANPIGFPQVFYDSREGPGQNIYTTQGVHFTAGTGWAVSAKALSITFDGITFIPLVDGTVDFHAAFIDSSVSGGFVTGNFTGVGGPLPDLIVADETGELAGTNYFNRTVRGALAATDGVTESSFVVVSGSLAPFYAQSGGIGSNNGDLFSINPSFSATTFANNFDGHIAGIVAPARVPEPSTLVLLSASLAGLLGYGWRRQKLKNLGSESPTRSNQHFGFIREVHMSTSLRHFQNARPSVKFLMRRLVQILIGAGVTLISDVTLGAPLHPTSLYINTNGNLVELIDNSGTLDGKPFSQYALFINPRSLDGNDVAFHVLFNDLSQGIYVLNKTNPGNITRITDTNTAVPGGMGNFSEFIGSGGVGAAVNSGTVAFYGEDALHRSGVYTSTKGLITAVADSNTLIPGGIGTFTSFSLPTTDSGNVAFRGAGSLGQLGIYTNVNGQLNVVADTNTAVPGGVGNFTRMTPWFSFDAGHIAFRGLDTLGQSGVYTDLSGQLTAVADTHTPIPGGTGSFTDFLAIGNQLSDDEVAFVGYGELGQAGVYTFVNGQFDVIADTDTPIPGGFGNFTDFGPLSLDDGNLVFLGLGVGQKGYYTNLGGQLRVVGDLNTLNFVDFSLLNGPSISGEHILFAAKTPEPSSIVLLTSALILLFARYRQGTYKARTIVSSVGILGAAST